MLAECIIYWACLIARLVLARLPYGRPLGMVADLILPDVHVNTCATIYHKMAHVVGVIDVVDDDDARAGVAEVDSCCCCCTSVSIFVSDSDRYHFQFYHRPFRFWFHHGIHLNFRVRECCQHFLIDANPSTLTS